MIAINTPENASPRSEPRWEVGRKLCLRILALFEIDPLSVKLSSVAFMELPGFGFSDLNPTPEEVVVAFEIAHNIWKLKHPEKP